MNTHEYWARAGDISQFEHYSFVGLLSVGIAKSEDAKMPVLTGEVSFGDFFDSKCW